MNKKKLIVLIVVILLIIAAVGYYFFKNKKVETPNNNNQTQQEVEQLDNNQTQNTTDNTDLRTKILAIVGISNEGKKQEALTQYLALEKDNPNDLMLLNNIASLYSDLSNWIKSEEYYKKLLAVHPDYINGYRMLAYLYQYRFNDDEASIKALIDDGLAKNNNNQSLLGWIVDYYQQKNEGDKALPYSKLLTGQLNK
jgi:tetratricopeptide (TPR) repeat protein